MALHLALLLTLAAVCCQASPLCHLTTGTPYNRLSCSHITDFTLVTTRLTSAHADVGYLVLRDSPDLVISRADFNHPACQLLRRVELVESNITSFSSLPFRALEMLLRLSLESNNMTAVDATHFNGLDTLKRLILSQNQIKIISDGAFNGIDKLEVLDLDHNHLIAINPQMFNRINSLLSLILDYNLLTAVDAAAFMNLANLTVIKLSHNKITNINSLTFRNNPELVMLDISGNQLQSLSVELFELNSKLFDLDLSGNDLKNLSNFPLNIPSLRGLHLSSCNIHNIPEGHFSKLRSLEMLNLGDNRISQISSTLLPPSSGCRYVILDDNELTSLSVQSFAQFHRIIEQYPKNENVSRMADVYRVSWSNNPWDCSTSDMVALRAQAERHSSTFEDTFLCDREQQMWIRYFRTATIN